MDLQLISYFDNIKRAIEIACTGNFSILIFTNYNSGVAEIIDSFAYYNNVIYLFKKYVKYDVTVELYDNKKLISECEIIMNVKESNVPFAKLWLRDHETTKSVIRRIKKNKNKITDKIKAFDSNACKTLLQNAYEKYTLQPMDIKQIVSVANVIAIMDDSAKIKAEHIAEAINYKVIT